MKQCSLYIHVHVHSFQRFHCVQMLYIARIYEYYSKLLIVTIISDCYPHYKKGCCPALLLTLGDVLDNEIFACPDFPVQELLYWFCKELPGLLGKLIFNAIVVRECSMCYTYTCLDGEAGSAECCNDGF